MPQFTPDDRDIVMHELSNWDSVAAVGEIGPGLHVVFSDSANEVVTIQLLVERHGWTVVSVDYGHPERMMTVMPITTVDDD